MGGVRTGGGEGPGHGAHPQGELAAAQGRAGCGSKAGGAAVPRATAAARGLGVGTDPPPSPPSSPTLHGQDGEGGEAETKQVLQRHVSPAGRREQGPPQPHLRGERALPPPHRHLVRAPQPRAARRRRRAPLPGAGGGGGSGLPLLRLCQRVRRRSEAEGRWGVVGCLLPPSSTAAGPTGCCQPAARGERPRILRGGKRRRAAAAGAGRLRRAGSSPGRQTGGL